MSSCSTRPTAAGSLRATSGRPPCRSTSPSSSSAPIRTSWNSARPTAERRHAARQRSTLDPLPCKLQLCEIIRINDIPDDKLWHGGYYFCYFLKLFALTSKHAGFQEEQEWR